MVHIVFPRYFNWVRELPRLSLANRQIMQVHTFFIALTVFLVGLLCLTSAGELIGTALGKKICFGLSLFWIIRLLIQLFGYSKQLWKGKTFETVVHILMICCWAYFSFIFAGIAWN